LGDAQIGLVWAIQIAIDDFWGDRRRGGMISLTVEKMLFLQRASFA
jgi:hypothetical protein